MTKITDISHEKSADVSFEKKEERRLKDFSKSMLRNTLFIGSYVEKRYVESLNSYRDVVKIADDELEFIENLQAVARRCRSFYPKEAWLGFTEPKTVGAPSGYNVWVTLDTEIFGTYWFKATSVKFNYNEICLKLQSVRPVTREDAARLNTSTDNNNSSFNETNSYTSLNSSFARSTNNSSTNNSANSESVLTWSNIKDATIYIGVLITILGTFAVQALKYLMEYFIRLIHELSGLIKVCNPLVIAFIGFIFQTLMGVLAFIAAMWHSGRQPVMRNVMSNNWPKVRYTAPLPIMAPTPNIRNRNNSRFYYNGYNNRGSSVRITPLD